MTALPLRDRAGMSAVVIAAVVDYHTAHYTAVEREGKNERSVEFLAVALSVSATFREHSIAQPATETIHR